MKRRRPHGSGRRPVILGFVPWPTGATNTRWPQLGVLCASLFYHFAASGEGLRPWFPWAVSRPLPVYVLAPALSPNCATLVCIGRTPLSPAVAAFWIPSYFRSLTCRSRNV